MANRRTLEVIEKAQALIERHTEGAEADAGFDAGEWSGPAHDRALNDALDRLAEEYGFTREALDGLLIEGEEER